MNLSRCREQAGFDGIEVFRFTRSLRPIVGVNPPKATTQEPAGAQAVRFTVHRRRDVFIGKNATFREAVCANLLEGRSSPKVHPESFGTPEICSARRSESQARRLTAVHDIVRSRILLRFEIVILCRL